MKTVVTYLDKDGNRTTKENAWKIKTQVYNDAGNLQRTGYSLGEAQIRQNEKENDKSLRLRIAETGEEKTFSKVMVKIGRDENCDIVFAAKEDKKKIEKVHVAFELREGKWHVINMSKNGTWISDRKLMPNVPTPIEPGDEVSIAGRKKILLL